MLKKISYIILIPMIAVTLTAQMITAPGSSTSGSIVNGSGLAGEIKGTWSWSGDREEYDGMGNGTYWRNSEICYRFTYTVNGDLVSTTADRDHNCGARRVNDWRIRIKGNIMYKEHAGSGYRTEWKRETAAPFRRPR